jgi:stearoyl-CoA desaturase (delta-9 desaturase)
MLEFLNANLYGLANLSIAGYVLVTLLWMHITMMGVTLYFHRDQAHRSVELHPAIRHFFRFWLWLSTGAPTKEWVSVHRKHHALCERDGDPHSPVIHGLKKVVLEGSELYMEEARNPATTAKYGKGTPDDWLERNVYGRFTYSGIGLLAVIDVVMFGAPGIIMLACQLVTMPFFAAGIINGVCHAKGYRNYETNDASTNLWPLGLFLAGEELHNNHHAFPTSARFSHRPREVDIGWLHLKVLEKLGLARIRRIANEPGTIEPQAAPDMESLRAVLVHRMHVLRHFMHNVTLPVLTRELDKLGDNTASVMRSARSWLTSQPQMLDETTSRRLSDLIERHPALQTVLEFRNELKELWEGAHTSNERLLADFRHWCDRAESSGNQYLEDFVAYLKSLRAVPALA